LATGRGLKQNATHSLTHTYTHSASKHTKTLSLSHTCMYTHMVCVSVCVCLTLPMTSPPAVWGRSICRHLFTRLEIDFMRLDNKYISNVRVEKKSTTYTSHICVCVYVCIYVWVYVCVSR